jgi:transcriptional regulator with XRE-family HTH domain
MMPRTKIAIDISQVEKLAAQGLSQSEICLCLGISEDTLTRRKQDSADIAAAINRGKARAASEVANVLYLKATKDKDLGAIIWWEKTRRGLSDKVQQNVTVDVTKLSDDELRGLLTT